jgi:hypothetical protein
MDIRQSLRRLIRLFAAKIERQWQHVILNRAIFSPRPVELKPAHRTVYSTRREADFLEPSSVSAVPRLSMESPSLL